MGWAKERVGDRTYEPVSGDQHTIASLYQGAKGVSMVLWIVCSHVCQRTDIGDGLKITRAQNQFELANRDGELKEKGGGDLPSGRQ